MDTHSKKKMQSKHNTETGNQITREETKRGTEEKKIYKNES